MGVGVWVEGGGLKANIIVSWHSIQKLGVGGGWRRASHSFHCLILSLFRKAKYTHSIYAKGYMVFIFSIHSFICLFIHKFIHSLFSINWAQVVGWLVLGLKAL